ncbi:MAG: hypothetical protein B7Y49_05195 [Sphingomonas sp. 28-62-11]|nr:MAG: hypothetical protein B7Y49_05195 [Sphingomonas sp. 28-62-11]
MLIKSQSRGSPWMMSMARHAQSFIAVDDLSRAERTAATVRMIIRFAPINVVTAVAMCVVYAIRFDQPFMAFASLPVAIVTLVSMALFQGMFHARWQLNPETIDRLMNVYALAIGLGWFVTIGALNTVPMSEDRVGISCVNVAIICLGGTVFTLLPEAGLVFMATVGTRLAIDLGMIVAVPALYVIAIMGFVLMLFAMAIGQARLFADRVRTQADLADLERRRTEDAQRVAEEQRALERAHERRRADEQQASADEQRALMNDHAQRFETSVAAAIGILSSAAYDLSESTANLTEMGKLSGAHVSAVRGRAVTVAQSMADVQRAAAELRQSIGEISCEVAGQVQATANAEIASSLARAQARALADSSAVVRGITAKIERIAQRTNTLALNALIEATQSGEAGAAFAVVAGEVKALAAQTREAALEIGHHIADMNANADDVAASVEVIASDVGRIAAGANDIARTIDAQRLSTGGIFAGVDSAGHGAEAVGADLQALADKADSALALASKIERVASNIGVQSQRLDEASSAFGARLRRA